MNYPYPQQNLMPIYRPYQVGFVPPQGPLGQRSSWVPTTVGAISVLASTSTGSVLADAAIGAGAGYLLAPAAARTTYMVAGAVLGGIGGFLGLLLLAGYAYVKR